MKEEPIEDVVEKEDSDLALLKELENVSFGDKLENQESLILKDLRLSSIHQESIPPDLTEESKLLTPLS